MRPVRIVSVFAFTMLAAPGARAQQVESFANLLHRINRDDRVRVEDQSGAKVTGRVVGFGRDGLTLRTDDGDSRFMPENVRRVDVRRGQSKAWGALIGAVTGLAIGSVVCAQHGASGCDPGDAALLIGAPMGTLAGMWVPRMHAVYRASPDEAAAPARETGVARASLLIELGMQVNLDDKLKVERANGTRASGRLSKLGDDEFAIAGGATNIETRFTREDIRRVSVSRSTVHRSTFIGFLGGAAAFAHTNDPGGLGGAFLGAAVGAIVGSIVHTTTVVYPATERPDHKE